MPRRSGLRAMKTLIGVTVLLIAAVVLGAAGIATLSSVLNPKHQTQLQRWVAGAKGERKAFPDAGVSLDFPDTVEASLEPVSLYLAGSVNGKRYISIVESDSVEFVWFKLPTSLVGAPNLPSTIANFVADGLGGAPFDGSAPTTLKPSGYQFRVHLRARKLLATTTTAAGDGPIKLAASEDYYVYVFVERATAYVLRIRAKSKGFEALHHFVGTVRRVPALAR